MNKAAELKGKGYCILEGLIDDNLCDQLLDTFNAEVKPYNQPLLRQRNVQYEKHRLTPNGHMANALLDVHRLEVPELKPFVQAAQELLGCKALSSAITEIGGQEPILVQTMYFESSKSTPPHFDHFFVSDSEENTMMGVWVALEDIEPGAGQFYVYPYSHLVDKTDQPQALQDVFNHYSKIAQEGIDPNNPDLKSSEVLRRVVKGNRLLQELIAIGGWEKYTPSLKKGDVLFFSSLTLHGSEYPTENKTRNSFTAHFLPFSEAKQIRFCHQFEPLTLTKMGDMYVHLSNRYGNPP